MKNKIFNIFYYIFLSFVFLLIILLIFSKFSFGVDYKILVVKSGSMEPTIQTGSLVLVAPKEIYKQGDIITFWSKISKKIPTTHRIVSREEKEGNVFFITKGDANKNVDTQKIKKKNIVGKVVFSVPYLGYALNFLKTKIGFVLIVLIPALLFMADEVKNIYKELRKMRKKNAHK